MTTHENGPCPDGWRPESRANPLDPPLTIPANITLGSE